MDVTSDKEFTVNFGTPTNSISANATYRIKISNGSGNFNQVRFHDTTLSPIYSCPDMYKIIDIAQWGNIQWHTFDNAFVLCAEMNVSATDIPDLSLVTSTQEMFFLCTLLTGNASFNNWDTSTITNMYNMFGEAANFNAPFGNWDTSKVTNMTEMFHETSFNYDLGQWNLSSLTNVQDMFLNSGMNCKNYDNTLYNWSLNPLTSSNVNLSNASPLVYSHPAAVNARNFLITSKGWAISGDSYNSECQSFLKTSDVNIKKEIYIYPNPAKDYIYVKKTTAAQEILSRCCLYSS